MLQTSQDLFFVIAAIAMVWVSVFLCWALYRLAIFLKSINEVTTDVRDRVQKAESFFDDIRSRLTRTVGVITAVQKGVEMGLTILQGRKKSAATKAKKGSSVGEE